MLRVPQSSRERGRRASGPRSRMSTPPHLWTGEGEQTEWRSQRECPVLTILEIHKGHPFVIKFSKTTPMITMNI